MALKALMLRRKIDAAEAKLSALREKDAEFKTRETELEEALNELTDDATDEERQAVEEGVDDFDTEKAAHEDEKKSLTDTIEELSAQLEEEERNAAEKAAALTRKKDAPKAPEKRKESKPMETREFFGMNLEERDRFFADEGVQTLIKDYRSALSSRAVTNIDLTIPKVVLPILDIIVEQTSKMLKYVKVDRVTGNARKRIWGTLPEAVWTEQRANINELTIGLNEIEVEGYKVGGLFTIDNSDIEDNDVGLVQKFLQALGYSIGRALDKAILYGTDKKMPLGVLPRLAQTAKPDSYPDDAPTWVDLHTSHVITISGKTGVALFQEIVKKRKLTKNDYSAGSNVWIMNENTLTDLMVESMGANMNAAIVAGMGTTMPVVGGAIETLSFIPDGDVIFGHFDMYQLADRRDVQMATSTEYLFAEDKTAFRGTARYDGLPVIPEAFAVFNIAGTAPTMTAVFPQDTANAKEIKSVTITGTAKAGEALTVTVDPVEAAVNYQWQVAATKTGTYSDISEATSKTYTVASGDATKYIRCVVTGKSYTSGTMTTAPTSAIAAAD